MASETADAAVPTPTRKKAKKNKPAEKYFDSYINNTKIANEIRKGEGVGKERSCNVFDRVHTTYKLSAPLSSLDCCVADAIYTLYKAAKDPQDRQAPVELSLSLSKILLVLTGNRQRTLPLYTYGEKTGEMTLFFAPAQRGQDRERRI